MFYFWVFYHLFRKDNTKENDGFVVNDNTDDNKEVANEDADASPSNKSNSEVHSTGDQEEEKVAYLNISIGTFFVEILIREIHNLLLYSLNQSYFYCSFLKIIRYTSIYAIVGYLTNYLHFSLYSRYQYTYPSIQGIDHDGFVVDYHEADYAQIATAGLFLSSFPLLLCIYFINDVFYVHLYQHNVLNTEQRTFYQ